ncbi:glycoside hydrolase family 78 protein [Nemania serpens]|nr:glycoside hydrolase family 78 protein [Nemania serpens]
MHTRSLIPLLWPAALTSYYHHPTHAQAQDPPSWQQYVRAPEAQAGIVRPVTVLPGYTLGDVENADGLVTGAAPTVLTRGGGSMEEDETPTLVVDFGQNVVGQLLLEFAGSTNGTATGSGSGFPGIRLAFSEALEFLTERSDYTRSDRAQGDPPQLVTTGTDQVAVKNAPYTWEDQWGCEYGSQVCADGLHAFRYVRISLDALDTDAPYMSAAGEVRIASVGLRWSGYRGTPDTYAGWFECSDADLTQWWFDGATSASLLGKLVLHDGAKRDRDPYMGDLAVASLTSYLSHGASAAAATLNVLEDLAAHQRADGWIPPASINGYSLALFDYPLYWVLCSWDYVFYTGDAPAYIDAHYDVLTAVLDVYYPAHTDATTQLLVRPDGYGDYAFLPRPGSAAYYSALYVLALNKAAALAELRTNNTNNDDAARWRDRAAAVSRGFHDTFWDASASAYLDRNCTGDAGCAARAHAQDGNSLAALAGIGDATTASAALAYLAANNARPYGNAFYDAGGEALGAGFSDRVYAFTSYFEGAARFEARGARGALDLIRRTWGWMAARDPGITHWEGVGADGTKYEGADTSLAHGWSTGVTPLLTSYVLGVRPTKPGFREWSVDVVVDTEDVSWARGVVPTPHGPLGVSWWVLPSGDIEIVVDPPEGTSGTVGGPAAGSERVAVRGGKETTVRFVGTKAYLV